MDWSRDRSLYWAQDWAMDWAMDYGLGFGLGFGLSFGLGFGLVYGPVQGLNYDWLGFIVACISQVFKGSIASLKCSCFLGDKTPHVVARIHQDHHLPPF